MQRLVADAMRPPSSVLLLDGERRSREAGTPSRDGGRSMRPASISEAHGACQD